MEEDPFHYGVYGQVGTGIENKTKQPATSEDYWEETQPGNPDDYVFDVRDGGMFLGGGGQLLSWNLGVHLIQGSCRGVPQASGGQQLGLVISGLHWGLRPSQKVHEKTSR